MCPALVGSISVLATGFQQDATLLRAIWWWGGQAASDGSQAPFLDVGFDKDETSLTKVDVDDGGAVGSDSREEVLRLETMDYLVEFLTVASKEDGSSSWPIPNSDNIALDYLRAIRSRREWLVIAT
jgi:hypothetical protein